MILQVFTILNLLCLIPDGFPVSMGIIIVPLAKVNCLMQTRVTQGTWTQTQETGASLKPRSFARCTWKLNTLDSTFCFFAVIFMRNQWLWNLELFFLGGGGVLWEVQHSLGRFYGGLDWIFYGSRRIFLVTRSCCVVVMMQDLGAYINGGWS